MVILRQFLDKDTLEILEKIVENVLAKSKNSIRKNIKNKNITINYSRNLILFQQVHLKNMGST